MDTIGTLIKKYREEHNLSMEEFGRKCGLSKAYISLIERGKNTRSDKPIVPSIDTVKAIADALGLDVDTLLNSTDPNQVIRINSPQRKGVRIPVLGTVVAGAPSYAVENIIGWEEVTPKMAQQGKLFALKIRGESMMPDLHPGDLIVVKETPDVESGETAVILINGDDATVKQVRKSLEGIVLYAKNPAVYEPHFYSNKDIEELPVKVIGKVIESRRIW